MEMVDPKKNTTEKFVPTKRVIAIIVTIAKRVDRCIYLIVEGLPRAGDPT